MANKERGFFVKYGEGRYSKPYLSLGETRADARAAGPNLDIFHGLLVYNDDNTVDATQLFLIPKVSKE